MLRDNFLALVIFAICSVGFFVWGYQYIPTNNYFLFLIAGMFGLFMAFNIGGNDVANSFGTSVGAKTLTLKQALVIAAIFELSGAIFAGSEVTNTIRNEIVKALVFGYFMRLKRVCQSRQLTRSLAASLAQDLPWVL